MAKLSDMFKQARRSQNGAGIGFLGKSKPETKARAAALVVELPTLIAGSAEAALKAGADGLLFSWNGSDSAFLETLKQEIESAKGTNENLVTGLHITGGWDKLDRDSLTNLKEQGIQYVVLPLDAPARLLALETKDLEMVVTVPMKSGDMYPLFIRNLTAFEGISAVLLDFGISKSVGTMTIEDVLQYRAVREAVRYPAFINVPADLTESDAYTLLTLGIQGLIFTTREVTETTRQQIKDLHTLLETVHHEEDKDSSMSLRRG
jgi:hypothetical protein